MIKRSLIFFYGGGGGGLTANRKQLAISKSFDEDFNCMETSKFICKVDNLTGFYTGTLSIRCLGKNCKRLYT